MGVWVAWGSTTTSRGTAWSPVSSGIPSLTAPDVSGYALSPMFHPFQINCSGRGLQRPYFKWKDVCNPLPLSLIDYNSRRPICGRISSPAHSALGGSSSGNWYRKAREDHIDFFNTVMEDDHPVDIAEQLKWPQVLRDFTQNLYAPQFYAQLVAWITRQYEQATYYRAVDSCLVSTLSTQSDSPLSWFALIDSPLDKSRWNDCLPFTKIKGCLIWTFIIINKTIMVDYTENEIKYTNTIPLNS